MMPAAKAIATAAPNRARSSVRDDIGVGPCLDNRNVWTLCVRRRATTSRKIVPSHFQRPFLRRTPTGVGEFPFYRTNADGAGIPPGPAHSFRRYSAHEWSPTKPDA